MNPVPQRVGLYLGALNFFFTLTWTVYVIFLPRLAAQAGIPKEWVLWILVLDQLIFAACDWAMGVAADRVGKTLGRLGNWVALVTGASCLAFLLLPFAAPAGSPWLFLLLTVTWSVTSSALRAPPLVLLGKHAPMASHPWLSSLALFGLGVAGAVSPYLSVALREADPRLPFALASVALIAATLGLSWAERTLAAAAPPQAKEGGERPPLAGFLLGVALLGLGFQAHFALNAAPGFLKFAKPADLDVLMPVFWIGFNLLMLPATLLAGRYGGLAVMALGALVGAAAAWATLNASGLAALVAAQFVAGGAWGCVLMSATAAALALGRSGREGGALGGMFSMLALATFARIALVAAQFNKDAGVAAILPWAPVALWLLAGAMLLAAARGAPTRA
jgi:hypothetical protein